MFVTSVVLLALFNSVVYCTPTNGSLLRNGKHYPSISLIPPESNLLSYLRNHNDLDCPYPYQNVGSVCIYAKNSCSSSVGLTYLSARIFCQTLGNANGDLAVFKNANGFQAMVDYLKFTDPAMICNYLLGVSQLNVDSAWDWISNNIAPLSVYDISWATGSPTLGVGPYPSYGIFDRSKLYRLTNVPDGQNDTSVICSVIPKRKYDVTFID